MSAEKKVKKTPDQIRKEIADKMVEALKGGTPPWRQPWAEGRNLGAPRNFQTDRRYTGVNPLILMLTAHVYGYESNRWGTFNAWLSHVGGFVKKGERATHITLFRQIPKKGKDGKPEVNKDGKPKGIMLMREYPVFNCDQVAPPSVDDLLDGRGQYSSVKKLLGDFSRTDRKKVTTRDELVRIAAKYLPAAEVKKFPKTMSREKLAVAITEGVAAKLSRYKPVHVVQNTDPDFGPAEELLGKSKADIRHGGPDAIYNLPPKDFIRLPNKSQFYTKADYYQSAFHELVHWAIDGKRVNVGQSDDPDKKRDYAFNELVAEIGSCFVIMELGVPLADKMIPKSQSYVKHWVEKMGSDTKYIFDAASQAGKVVDFLLGFVGKANPAYVGGDDDSEEQEMPRRAIA